MYLPYYFTARKRSLGQGNIFAPVCHSVHRGDVSQHALQVVSQHALQQVSGGVYPSMPCRSPGGSPGLHPGEKLRGLARGVSRPTPRGVSIPTPWGSPVPIQGVSIPTPRGVSRPTPRGVSRPTPRGCIPECTEADPPMDGYCHRWYASYWNAFLLPTAREGNVFTPVCHSVHRWEVCLGGGGSLPTPRY